MWMDFLKSKSQDETKITLVGNKLDKEDQRQVTTQDGIEKAKSSNALFLEVSAKSGERVFELFRSVTSSLADIDAGTFGNPETDIKLNSGKVASS